MEEFLNTIQTLIYECNSDLSSNYLKFVDREGTHFQMWPTKINITFIKIKDNQWKIQPSKIQDRKKSVKKTNYTNADLIEIIKSTKKAGEQSAILVQYDSSAKVYWLKDALVKYIEDTAIRVDSSTDVVSSMI